MAAGGDLAPLTRPATARRLATGLFVLVAITVAACTDGSPLTAPGGPSEDAGDAVVTEIVDGDTIEVAVAGTRERVRLIGINTPETVAPERPVQCYGPEASARIAELLPAGTTVRLERDEVTRDQYDRLLAYVWRAEDDVLVNLAMIQEGYAAAVTYGDNEALYRQFAASEADARADGVGLWGACGSPNVDLEPGPDSGD